jgi:ATPase family associated with various cellular activities (AAA)
LTVIDEVNLDALPKTQFATLVLEREIPHTTQSQWDTSSCSLGDVLEYASSTSRTTRAQTALLDLEPLFGERSLALFDLQGGSAHVRIASAERAMIADIERWLRDLFPVPQITERREVPVRFWSCGPRGAKAVSRTIAVPGFDEVRENYPLAARERLGRLLGPDFRPAEGGQLILWHGAPGTGKTYALRALGWEWRNWCELHYVIDPEVFFGQRADYMLDVVLGQDSMFNFDDDEEGQHERKWRLLVLEDTGELLAADAKERTGQGLSRLLNPVDGIIGQGLRVLVLVTTNEPLRRLHPAVARPGRCAARLEFEPFPAAEAVAWLAEHGVDDQSAAATTLANLFARVEGYETEAESPVGFRR